MPEEAKVYDADGKPLERRAQCQGPPQGARRHAGRQPGRPAAACSARSASSGKPGAAADDANSKPAGSSPASPPAASPLQQDTSKLVPLNDLGSGTYQGFPGGLYPDGKNRRPAPHEAAGVKLAAQVQPLDADGKPSSDGRIVLLGIGFSNTVQAFHGFMEVAEDDRQINPKLLLVNGAVGGMSASMVQDAGRPATGTKYWNTVDERLKAAGAARRRCKWSGSRKPIRPRTRETFPSTSVPWSPN